MVLNLGYHQKEIMEQEGCHLRLATPQSLDLAIMNYTYTGQAWQSVGIALIPFGAQLATQIIQFYKQPKKYESTPSSVRFC